MMKTQPQMRRRRRRRRTPFSSSDRQRNSTAGDHVPVRGTAGGRLRKGAEVVLRRGPPGTPHPWIPLPPRPAPLPAHNHHGPPPSFEFLLHGKMALVGVGSENRSCTQKRCLALHPFQPPPALALLQHRGGAAVEKRRRRSPTIPDLKECGRRRINPHAITSSSRMPRGRPVFHPRGPQNHRQAKGSLWHCCTQAPVHCHPRRWRSHSVSARPPFR
jgi:hypothetical protein